MNDEIRNNLMNKVYLPTSPTEPSPSVGKILPKVNVDAAVIELPNKANPPEITGKLTKKNKIIELELHKSVPPGQLFLQVPNT